MYLHRIAALGAVVGLVLAVAACGDGGTDEVASTDTPVTLGTTAATNPASTTTAETIDSATTTTAPVTTVPAPTTTTAPATTNRPAPATTTAPATTNRPAPATTTAPVTTNRPAPTATTTPVTTAPPTTVPAPTTTTAPVTTAPPTTTTTAPVTTAPPTTVPSGRPSHPYPLVDNGFVTEAGVRRSFPNSDPRCSEDATVEVWFEYANGEVLTSWRSVPTSYTGVFTDSWGTPVPHPFDVARHPDGSLECMFIYGWVRQ